MDFCALSVLVEAQAAGSLAGAARRLRIAPMTATRSLAELEAELGVRLVHRTTRALALTSEGMAFLPHAQKLLDAREAALASVRPSEGAAGLLRLTASVAFGRKIVAPVVVGFMRDNPEVAVDLLMTDDVVDIVPAGIDLAVRIAKLSDSGLVARELAANPRRLLASVDYIKRHGIPRTLGELGQHSCLAITGTTHWAFRTDDRLVNRKITGRFTANSIEGLLQICLGGLGIANLSAWFVEAELAGGTLREVRLADAEPEPLSVWAVYPTRVMVPPKVRLFIDALAASLRRPDVSGAR